MNAIQKWQNLSMQLGAKHGESAADFRKRNPEAAKKMAEFIIANKAALTKEIAGKCAS